MSRPCNGRFLFCLEVCLQKKCHESHVKQAIAANSVTDLSAALERPKCLGALFPDVNLAAEGALHLAAETASPELIHTLLLKGADVNATDEHKNTPLHAAARRGDPDVLMLLLKEAAIAIDSMNAGSLTALLVAAKCGHWDCCAKLLRAGANAQPEGYRVSPGNGRSARFSEGLRAAQEVMSALAALWPQSAVRFCAVGQLTEGKPLAMCAPQTAPSDWASRLAKTEVQQGEQMLQRVLNSARIKEHPRLTVSTEKGMLHYELQQQTQLLFLAITQPDMKQSSAFAFLHELKMGFVAFDAELRASQYDAVKPKAIRLLRALSAKVNASVASLPSLSVTAQLLFDEARSLDLHLDPAAADAPPREAPRRDVETPPETAAMTASQVHAHLSSQILALASGLNLGRAKAIALLRRFGWDYGEVMRACDAQPSLLSQVFPPAATREGEAAEVEEKPNGSQLRAWLQSQVLEGTHVPLTYPPTAAADGKPSKPEPVPEDELQRLLPADMLAMYEANILRSFISESECWQPCPRPGCQFSVHCLDLRHGTSVVDVPCACEHRFCWHCRREEHQPLPCAMVSAWQMVIEAEESPAEAGIPPTAEEETSAAELQAVCSKVDSLTTPVDSKREARANIMAVRLIINSCLGPSAEHAAFADRLPGALSTLLDARRLLRVSYIAQRMLERPLASTRAALPAEKDQAGPPGHQQLARLQRQLDFLCSLLGQVLELPHESPEGGDSEQTEEAGYAHKVRSAAQQSADKLGRIRGERAISLLQHATLLWAGNEQLTTLFEAVRLTTADLRGCLVRLVRPQDAKERGPFSPPKALIPSDAGWMGVVRNWMGTRD
ncbi:hypothetical protein AB1Y20_013509 [Prymnesium parvum]|uniref:IBR domain-containing protein n=1 Tax=Prymnesium parvum TaxID=97485 RepID=A0AB34IG26_PRYPA